jgi:hypothetical protein
MNGCWKKLCPDLVQDFKGFEETPEATTKEVVQLMNELDWVSALKIWMNLLHFIQGLCPIKI